MKHLAAILSAFALLGCATAPAQTSAQQQPDIMGGLSGISEARLLLVRVYVSDLDRSQHFYEQVFGLRVAHTVGHERILTFADTTRPNVVLMQNNADAPRTNGNFAIGVPNIDEIVSRVSAAGGTVRRPPNATGAFRISIITDPDGASIEVIQPAPPQ